MGLVGWIDKVEFVPVLPVEVVPLGVEKPNNEVRVLLLTATLDSVDCVVVLVDDEFMNGISNAII